MDDPTEKSNTKLKVALAVLITAIATFSLLAFIGYNIEEAPSENPITAYDPNRKLSLAERQAFMDGCVDNSATREFCECSLGYLESWYTQDEIFEFALEADQGSIPNAILDAAEYCSYKQL